MKHLLASALLSATPALAQSDSLIVDLNTDFESANNSSVAYLASDGTFAYFTAESVLFQREIWRTDGTPEGTQRLTDFGGPYLGLAPAVGGPIEGIAVNGEFIFEAAFEGDAFIARVDSTAGGSGAVELATIQGVQAPSGIGPLFVEHAGDIFFIGDDVQFGTGVWRTDGTVAGTEFVIDLGVAGAQGNFPARLLSTGADLYIYRNTGAGPAELLVSDGTQAGTQVLGALGSPSPQLVAFQGKLVFTQGGGTPLAGVWITDGTLAGTARLAITTTPGWIVPTSNTLFFTISLGGSTHELWSSDGTLGGTAPVGVQTASTPGKAFGSGLLHGGFSPSTGFEPTFTDAATLVTTTLYDLEPGPNSSVPRRFEALGSGFAFLAKTAAEGLELWRGSLAPGVAAELAFEFTPDDQTSVYWQSPQGQTLFPVADGLAFTGYGVGIAFNAQDVQRVNETEAGLVAKVNPDDTRNSDPDNFVRVGSLVFFTADGTNGRALYRTDGTAEGTVLLAEDSGAGIEQVEIRDLKALGNRLYFLASATGLAEDRLPWVSDGTPAGTQPVFASNDPLRPRFATEMIESNGQLVLSAHAPGSSDYALWSSDGTASGTVVDVVLPTPLTPNAPEMLTSIDAGTFFVYNDGVDGGKQGWISNGTAAGTFELTQLNTSATSSSDYFGSRSSNGAAIWFYVHFEDFLSSLMYSDGTIAGTREVVGGIGLNEFNSGVQAFRNGAVFISGDLFIQGVNIWGSNSDGTATTHLLNGQYRSMAALGAPDVATQVILASTNFLSPLKPVVTDGTVAGTQVLLESTSSFPQTNDDSSVELIASDGSVLLDTFGGNAWVSDGTDSGTFEIDFGPRPELGERSAVRLGDRLLVAADDFIYGTELHSFPMLDTLASSFDSVLDECPGSPRLAGSGVPTSGSSVSFETMNAAPNEFVFTLLGGSLLPLPDMTPCGLALDSWTLFDTRTADANGAASLPISVPTSPTLIGASAAFQVVTPSPGGPVIGAFDASGVLEVFVGP